MKPEDLKPPCSKYEQRVMISDRIWYVPTREISPSPFNFPGWDHADLFGNNNPVCVEYCSGNGLWIAEKAMANPHLNWVAVEKKFVRVRKIWSKIKNLKLDNLIVICGEAHKVTKTYFPDNSVADVYINFPDPWPKSRHAKHRLIQDEFAQQIWRILKDKQSLTFVTDDPPYSEWLIEIMSRNQGFKSLYPAPFFVTTHADYGTSFFEDLWRSQGRIIRYHQYQKSL